MNDSRHPAVSPGRSSWQGMHPSGSDWGDYRGALLRAAEGSRIGGPLPL